jgi:predicted AAA+ superfamily ATPase
MEETDRRMKETDRRFRETERIVKENSRQIGGLHNSFGELAEHLVVPGIVKQFNKLGYNFDDVSPGGRRIHDEEGNVITEIDLLLENGSSIMALEVKSKPKEKDVEHHVKRLEILRGHKAKHNDTRKIYGAIAGAVFGIAEKKATIDAGLFVIEQSGDTMKIDVPPGFVPREW